MIGGRHERGRGAAIDRNNDGLAAVCRWLIVIAVNLDAREAEPGEQHQVARWAAAESIKPLLSGVEFGVQIDHVAVAAAANSL